MLQMMEDREEYTYKAVHGGYQSFGVGYEDDALLLLESCLSNAYYTAYTVAACLLVSSIYRFGFRSAVL